MDQPVQIPGLVADVLSRARREGTPLIDGDTATFVWEGEEAPRLVGDFNHWGGEIWGGRTPSIELDRIAPAVWAHTMTLPSDAYLEYMFLRGGERILDPLNPKTIYFWVPEGDFNNWFAMPEFTETPLLEDRIGVPRGTITHHEVDGGPGVLGDKRAVHLYRPPLDRPCPLLVVLHGQALLERYRLRQIVDNLIADGRIQPLALALVHVSDEGSWIECNCSDSMVTFLVEHVLPRPASTSASSMMPARMESLVYP
jgi:enterochelin esterase family protein